MYNFRHAIRLLAAAGVVAIVAIACGTEEDSPAAAQTPGGDTPPAAVPQPQTGAVVVDAPIVDAIVLIRESFPPSYALQVTSGLPDSCHAFNDIDVQRDGDVVNVHVTNTRLTSLSGEAIACAQVFGMDDHTVDLPGDYETGKTFTVNVNDEVRTFIGQSPAASGQNSGGEPTSADVLFDEFKVFDPDASRGDEVFQPFFPVTGELQKVLGESIQVYVFASPEDAGKAASGITDGGSTVASPDGAVSSISWIATPHFYLDGDRIVLYVGDNAEILGLLNRVAGDPVGGDPPTGGLLPSRPASGDDPVAAEPGDEPEDVVFVPAPVEFADVAILESFPPQYVLNVTIGIPSGCDTFSSYDVKRDGRIVSVQILNERPADAMICTTIYGYHDLRIPLEGPFETGTEFDVIINGERQGTFAGQG